MRLIKSVLALTAVLLAITLLANCKDKGRENIIEGTSYTLKSNIANGVFRLYPLTITFLECNPADARVDSNKVRCPDKGTPYTYAANEASHHLKIRLDSDEGTHRWVDSIFTLVPDENICIVINFSISDLLGNDGGSLRQTEPKLNE